MTNQQVIALLSDLVAGLPGVTAKPSANHISFVVGNKVFAYTTDAGLVLKLPKARVSELTGRHYATRLVMGKRSMAEWAVLHHDEPEAYSDDRTLLLEAHDFVSAKENVAGGAP